MVYLKQGERGLYCYIDGKIHFPDRHSALKEGFVDNIVVTLDKGKYAFIKGDNVSVELPSAEQVLDTIVANDRERRSDFFALLKFSLSSGIEYYSIRFHNSYVDIALIDNKLTVLSTGFCYSWLNLNADTIRSDVTKRDEKFKTIKLRSIIDLSILDKIDKNSLEFAIKEVNYNKLFVVTEKSVKLFDRHSDLCNSCVLYKNVPLYYVDVLTESDKRNARDIEELFQSLPYGKYVGNRSGLTYHTLLSNHKLLTAKLDGLIWWALGQSILEADVVSDTLYVWLNIYRLHDFIRCSEDKKEEILLFLEQQALAVENNIRYMAKHGVSANQLAGMTLNRRKSW